MNSITKFCIGMHISKPLENAFLAYIRSHYSQKYGLRNGETMKFAVERLNEAEVKEAWQDFVRDFKSYLLSAQ